MNTKCWAIFLLILLIGIPFSSNSFTAKNSSFNTTELQRVKICINNQDSQIELSIDEAEQIKHKFLDIENNFIGAEKIREQLKIMHEIGILYSNYSLELLFSIMNKLNNSKDQLSIFPWPHLIVGGPMIVSHFSIGNRISGILPLNTGNLKNFTFELKGFLNGSYFHQVIGFLPYYLGVSFKPVYITAIGFNIMGSKKSIFFPFIELLIPCIGTSIAFYLKTKIPMKNPLFEYNIDVCLAGFLGGMRLNQI